MQKEENHLQRTVSMCLLAVVVFVIVLVISAYTHMSQRQIEEYAIYSTGQNTKEISTEVDAYISYGLSNIRLTSSHATQAMTGPVLEHASEVIAPLLDQTPFNFIEYTQGDGTNITDMGETFDASDRVYYQQGIAGKTGIWVNYHPKYSQEFLLDFYTPLFFEDEIVGVLTGTLGADTNILPMLTTSFFGEEMIGILCEADGQIISSTRARDGAATLQELLTGFGIGSDGQQIFEDHIQQRDNSVFEFTGTKGRSIACAAVSERTGWMVIQIVPASSFKAVVQKTSGTAYNAIGVIAMALVAYLVYLAFIANRFRHKSEQQIAEQTVLSNTDRLTGFNNRRAYEDDLLVYPDVPTEDDYVYISADVNGLKAVNDTLGHAAGDELLQGAAQCMERCLGTYGKLYRIGGDEFVAMVFADEKKLENMLSDLTEATRQWRGQSVRNLSISWGCASHKEFPQKTVKELARLADERMYQAKANYYTSRGIDRRHRQSAYTALCATYTKILKVNLTEDKYQIVLMDLSEQNTAQGFAEKISAWLHDFGTSGQVHPDDLEAYLNSTRLEYLRSHFASGQPTLTVFYRRRLGDGYRHVMMEMIAAEDYTEQSQVIYLYVKSIEK